MIAHRDFADRDGGSVRSVGALDGLNDGLWCQSAMNVSGIGNWTLPDGNLVPNDLTAKPVHMANSPGQVGLLRSEAIGKPPYQGMYTCSIPDENGVNHTLVVWASGGPAYNGAKGNREFKISLHDYSLSLHLNKSRNERSISHLCNNNMSVLIISCIARSSLFKLYKRVETQMTNQRQCDRSQWPEANVGQQY